MLKLLSFQTAQRGEAALCRNIMGKNELLYVIKPSQQTKETLLQLLADHKEVQFVSLMGVDLAGNDTDEKIFFA